MSYLDEVLHLRAQLKTSPDAAKAMKEAVATALKASGINVSDDLIKQMIIAVPDELGGMTEGVPILPVPNA